MQNLQYNNVLLSVITATANPSTTAPAPSRPGTFLAIFNPHHPSTLPAPPAIPPPSALGAPLPFTPGANVPLVYTIHK